MGLWGPMPPEDFKPVLQPFLSPIATKPWMTTLTVPPSTPLFQRPTRYPYLTYCGERFNGLRINLQYFPMNPVSQFFIVMPPSPCRAPKRYTFSGKNSMISGSFFKEPHCSAFSLKFLDQSVIMGTELPKESPTALSIC